MDRLRIDDHKLMYHVHRVNDWLSGGLVYPIYVEIATSGTCNHRCTFCALDYLGYQRRFLDTQVLRARLTEMADRGVKSVMYAGEGEPLLHKDIGEIILFSKSAGLDVAVTTNAVLLRERLVDQVLGAITWIRASIGGGTAETYSSIHRTRAEDFNRVLTNLAYAAKVKSKNKYDCTLGAQLLLLPENYQEAGILAKTLRDIGLDYLIIKPYSQHPLSLTRTYSDLRYGNYLRLRDDLQEYNHNGFQVVFRLDTMQKLDELDRGYARCYGLPFWAYIDAAGNVCGCSAYLGNEALQYGNINEHTFSEIWEGGTRLRSLHWTEDELDIAQCRQNCRMDKINQYLWELRNPPEHVNFI